MAFSKHLAGANCTEIMHPWTDSCVQAYRTMFRSSIIGGAKMFLPLILVSSSHRLWIPPGMRKFYNFYCLTRMPKICYQPPPPSLPPEIIEYPISGLLVINTIICLRFSRIRHVLQVVVITYYSTMLDNMVE